MSVSEFLQISTVIGPTGAILFLMYFNRAKPETTNPLVGFEKKLDAQAEALVRIETAIEVLKDRTHR